MKNKLRRLAKVCEDFDSYQVDTTGVQEEAPEGALAGVIQDIQDAFPDMLPAPVEEVTVEVNPETTQVDLQKQKVEYPTVDVIHFALETLAQVRLWHWQTGRHSTHVILGDLYDSLSENFDAFVEQTIGAFGVTPEYSVVKAEPYESADVCIQIINEWISTLSDTTEVFSDNPDLASVRDNIVSAMRKAVYLLRME